jgi:hypothetical protein
MKRLLAIVLVSFSVGCGATPPPEREGTETRSQELKIPNVTVGKGTPTGTYFNGTLFLAYTGTDGNVHTLQRSNGTFIDRKTLFTPKDGPSLIAYHGKLFLTWIHKDGERFFSAAKSFDGIQWTDAGSDVSFDHLKDAPGMAIYRDVMTVFTVRDRTFWGNSWVQQFNYNEDSNVWSFAFNPGLESTIGASAAVLGNDLFVAGVDGDRSVLIQKFDSVFGWQIPTFVSRFERAHLISAATATPSLLLLGSQYANIGPNQIRFDRTFDGVNLEDLGRIGDTTNERPHGIRADDSSAELVYRGTNNGLYLINVGLPAN